MHDVIMEILYYLIAAAGIAFIRILWPWIKEQAETAEARLKAENHDLAASIIREAVSAAEQTVQGVSKGSEKKEKARELIKEGLADNGISLSDAEVDRMIEAFVGDMNKAK